jgi:hypothetical protein
MTPTPHAEYSARLKVRQARAQQCEALHLRLATVRLCLAAATAFMAVAALKFEWIATGWLLLPIAAFLLLAAYHSQVGRNRDHALRAVAFFERGLARIEDRWHGTGEPGARFADATHVYSGDLDLFGSGSLFELLSSARTRMGEEELARWLQSPAVLPEISRRHACIVELRDRLELREQLALLGAESAAAVHPGALSAWAEAPNQLNTPLARWAAYLVPLAFVATAIFWGLTDIATPLLVSALLAIAVLQRLKQQLQHTLGTTETAFEDLKLLASLLRTLEHEAFSSSQMQQLVRRLGVPNDTASRIMAQLATVVHLVESRRNFFMQLLELPLLYSLQVALAAERWRRRYGHLVRSWLEVTGEIEALLSLAAYSYEHPDDPFPEFADGPAAFTGVGIGHPLLPAAKCVRNDVSIEGRTRMLLVSGSNMSGKSTLLRTVGINTVLAMAGAPTRAASLRLTPLQIGASIRTNDSLLEGNSRFYAEITRLRQLYDLTERDVAVMVLLDEVLQGTNSHDRRIGVEGMVSAFIQRGALGLISTHDLALTDIRGVPDGQVLNMHFQDELRAGRMSFDFKLRPGVVTKSNGVELMRSIGLKV